MGAFRNLASLLFILCIPAALVTSNVRFLTNEARIYRYAIDNYGAVQASGIERSDLLRASDQLRQYLNNGEGALSILVHQQGKEVSLFNGKETLHLEDVRTRFRIADRVQEFSVLYLITYIAVAVLWAREVSTRRLAIQVVVGSLLTLAVIGAAGGIALSGFETAWDKFHVLAFSNDFFRLNPRTDHLIQMFPEDFWQSIVFFLGLLVAVEAALMLLVAGIYLGVTSRQTAHRGLTPSYT